jgi:hypothetical protein
LIEIDFDDAQIATKKTHNPHRMRLYEIAQEFKDLYFIMENDCEYDEETGEVVDNSELIAELFNQISSTLEDKLDNAAYIVKELTQTSEAIKSEAKRLSARASNLEKNAEKLKSLMAYAFEQSGHSKIETLKWTFGTRKSEVVEIDSVLTPEDISRKYTRLKREFDKAAIREALKSGVEIEHTRIVTKHNFQIK